VPDSFGHIEQMPQILNGFGISSYFFNRGKAEQSPPDEMSFAWIGPDQRSRVTAHHLPAGYGNAMMLSSGDHESLKARLETILGPYRTRDGKAGPSLLLNGFDHIWVQRDLPRVLAHAATLVPDVEFVIGTLGDFIAAQEQHLGQRELPQRRGCLRDPNLLPTHLHGTWSSRIDNKLENASAAAILEGLTEPAAAMLLTAGGLDRRADLTLAWQWVLQNHAHDSICGCSMDAVHADVSARFRHAEELSEMIAADAIQRMAGEAERPALVRLAGLGGAPACCELIVDAADDRPVAVVGPDGKNYPTQYLGLRRLRRQDCLITETGDSSNLGADEFVEHRLLALLPEAPPVTWQTFEVAHAAQGDAPVPADAVRATDRSLENQFVRVDVDARGLIRLTHKPTGQVFDRLFELLDDADAGGGYMFKPLDGEVPERSSDAADVHVEVIERGPVRGTLRITARWLLPVGLNATEDARAGERVACDVEFRISLASNEDQLTCRLELVNRAIEHRVRLNVPLPFHADRASAERAFVVADEDLLRFTAAPGQQTHPMRNWVAVSDERGAAGVAFVGRGLHEYALEDAREEGGTSDLRVTLLRSVPFVDFCGAWRTPDAEMRRTLAYEFAVIPFAGDWRSAGIAARAHRFVHRSAAEVVGGHRPSWEHLPHATIRIEEQRGGDEWVLTPSHRSAWRRHFGERDGWRRRERRAAPHPQAAASPLVRVSGDQVLLSCVKPAEGGAEGGGADSSRDLIVRFYSLAARAQVVTLTTSFAVASAWETDLAEAPRAPLSFDNAAARVHIRPFEIATVRIRPAATS
jgi:alpha-mannosidase